METKPRKHWKRVLTLLVLGALAVAVLSALSGWAMVYANHVSQAGGDVSLPSRLVIVAAAKWARYWLFLVLAGAVALGAYAVLARPRSA